MSVQPNPCHPERSEGSMRRHYRSLDALGMTPFSRRLLQGRDLVGQRRAMQIPDLGVIVAAGAVHGRAVVPHDQIVRPPDMGVNELALCRVLVEVAQESARLGHRPALDLAGMARE